MLQSIEVQARGPEFRYPSPVEHGGTSLCIFGMQGQEGP